MKRSAPDRVDVLLACSEGGHLLELACLDRAWHDFSRAWVAPDSEDVRSLLRDERVYSIPASVASRPRSVRSLALSAVLAWRALSRLRPRVILATGSSVVVPFAWLGRLRGSRVVYLECGGRVEGVSLSCRLIAPIADVVYVQWPEQTSAVRRGRYVGRVPLSHVPHGHDMSELSERTSVFVTVGSGSYPFDRLIDAVQRLPDANTIVVQRGVSRVRPAGARCFDFLPFERVLDYVMEAPVVVSHAGIGSVLLALAHGKRPIVMARRQALGENVDDHQVAFALKLDEAGLVQVVENADELARAVSERTSHSFEGLEENERLPDELHERLSRACAA